MPTACRLYARWAMNLKGGDHAGAGAEGEGGGGTVRVGSVKFPPSVLCAAAACNFSSPCARQRFGAFSAGSGLRTTRLCRLCEPPLARELMGLAGAVRLVGGGVRTDRARHFSGRPGNDPGPGGAGEGTWPPDVSTVLKARQSFFRKRRRAGRGQGIARDQGFGFGTLRCRDL